MSKSFYKFELGELSLSEHAMGHFKDLEFNILAGIKSTRLDEIVKGIKIVFQDFENLYNVSFLVVVILA